MGGGGLYGTALDYLRFVRMMLNEGRSDRGDAILSARNRGPDVDERNGRIDT